MLDMCLIYIDRRGLYIDTYCEYLPSTVYTGQKHTAFATRYRPPAIKISIVLQSLARPLSLSIVLL